jgi:Photosynthetic reaction centre protein
MGKVFYPIWEAASLDEWLYNGGPYQLIVCHFFIGICCYMGREWELSFRLGIYMPLSFCELRHCTGLIAEKTKSVLTVLIVFILRLIKLGPRFFFIPSHTSQSLGLARGGKGKAIKLLVLSKGEKVSQLNVFSHQSSPPNEDNTANEGSRNTPTYKKKVFTAICPSVEEIQVKTEQLLGQGSDAYLEFIVEATLRAKRLLKEDPNTYCEKHHIVPKFKGGSNEESNLVFLTFNDHAIAHFIRWVVYKDPRDQTAWNIMSVQSEDWRREIASLGGKIGGVAAQKQHKENKVGWFDSEAQRERGRKSAALNKEQGTGAWDPENLTKANKVIAENSELYKPQQLKNLKQGRLTQKELGINLGDPAAQRLKSMMRYPTTVEINGKEYSLNQEHRIYICETTLNYYLHYAPKKKEKKTKKNQ